MSDLNIRPVLTGQKALVVGRSERAIDRVWLREGVSDRGRRAGDHLAERKVATLRRAVGAGACGRPSPARWTSPCPANWKTCSTGSARSGESSTFSCIRLPSLPRRTCRAASSNCSAEGFAKAMDVSCHSFVRMAKLAAPLMTDGGAMFAMSYYGANRVVANYNVMGPVKAALEAACRYLAYELGPQGIRVHAISPGPLKTRAASGLKDFELLLNEAAQKAPLGELVDIMDVGFACAYLATSLAQAHHGWNGLCRRRRQHRRLTALELLMSGCVAVINAGSSSVKFALYEATRDAALLYRGQIEGIGVAASPEGAGCGGRESWLSKPGRQTGSITRPPRAKSWRRAGSCSAGAPVIGDRTSRRAWRTDYDAPVRLDRDVLANWQRCSRWRRCTSRTISRRSARSFERRRTIPQVACFDTAFHRSQSHRSRRHSRFRAASAKPASGATDFTGCPTSTCAAAATSSAPEVAAEAAHRRASRQRRQPVRRASTAAASPARWASPRSTA